jgi:hypothetical protein
MAETNVFLKAFELDKDSFWQMFAHNESHLPRLMVIAVPEPVLWMKHKAFDCANCIVNKPMLS